MSSVVPRPLPCLLLLGIFLQEHLSPSRLTLAHSWDTEDEAEGRDRPWSYRVAVPAGDTVGGMPPTSSIPVLESGERLASISRS